MATTQSAPDAYSQLLAQCREISLLSGTSALLAWDQETLMPKGAGERRAEQLALLASLVHERATAPRLVELWERDPCDDAPDYRISAYSVDGAGGLGGGAPALLASAEVCSWATAASDVASTGGVASESEVIASRS